LIQPSHQRELILRSRSEASTGDDERRSVEIGGPRREVLVGQRRIILEVRVEVLKHQEDADNWAWSTAGLIRTRLERQSSVEALRAISMAAIEIGPSTDISYTYQDREVSAAMFELTLIG